MHLLPTSLLVLLGAAVSVTAAGGPMPRRLDHSSSHPAHHRSIVRARAIPVQAAPSLPKREAVVPVLVQDTHDKHAQQARSDGAASAETVARRQKKRGSSGKCVARANTSSSSSPSASVVASSSTRSTSASPSPAPATSSKPMVAPSPSSSSKAAAVSSSKPTSSSSPAAAPPAPTSAAQFKAGWTSLSSPVQNLQSISLATALKSTKGTKPGELVTSTLDGSLAMEAAYKANTAAAASGWSFYATYGQTELRRATEAVLTYKLYFADGFTWVKGGKLPGLYGGIPGEYGCSGGEQEDRDICWSARLMWRANGAGELYTYLPKGDTNINACKASGPNAICNNEIYGLSFGRGEFTWPSNQWATVQERVRLNDVGQNNGVIELSVNGKTVIKAQNLNIRTRADSGFEGIHMSTFFGGNDASYAPTTGQKAWFKDFQVGIVY